MEEIFIADDGSSQVLYWKDDRILKTSKISGRIFPEAFDWGVTMVSVLMIDEVSSFKRFLPAMAKDSCVVGG
ncbi:hypothetical protein Tco_1550650 [Tanacetum coccineum]